MASVKRTSACQLGIGMEFPTAERSTRMTNAAIYVFWNLKINGARTCLLACNLPTDPAISVIDNDLALDSFAAARFRPCGVSKRTHRECEFLRAPWSVHRSSKLRHYGVRTHTCRLRVSEDYFMEA